MQMRLLLDLLPTTWFREDPSLIKLVSFRAASLTFSHGHTEESPSAYLSCALALVLEGQYAEALEFGRVGVELSFRCDNPIQQCWALNLFAGCVSYWREPISSTLALLRQSIVLATQSGERLVVGHAVQPLLSALMETAVPLDQVLAEIDGVLEHCRRFQHSR